MHHFNYQAGELYGENVPVREIAAQVGTPFYLYSAATLSHHYRVFEAAFSRLSPYRLLRGRRPTPTWPS